MNTPESCTCGHDKADHTRDRGVCLVCYQASKANGALGAPGTYCNRWRRPERDALMTNYCANCGGDGFTIEENTCPACQGSGRSLGPVPQRPSLVEPSDR